MIKAMMYNQP